jgi:hypothetical protein
MSQRTVVITVEETYDLTKVLFNGVPHLVFVRREALGFQAWKNDAGSCYSVELTFRDGATILTEYDDLAKWTAVVVALTEHLTQ